MNSNGRPMALITFEGVEGSGKSTLMRRLGAALEACGRRVIMVREPGTTELGESVRRVVLEQDQPVEPWAELFLMLASRAQLVREVILAPTAQDAIVLCDRYMDASVAYQGGGRGLGLETVQGLNKLATQDRPPDLTLLVDLDPAVGRARRAGPQDRMEREHSDFHEMVRQTYLELARDEPHRFFVMDGTLPPQELAECAWARIRDSVDGLPLQLPDAQTS